MAMSESDLIQQFKTLQTLRETKGKEDEAQSLGETLIISAESSENWEMLAKLYWELHLIWQHRVMSERAKDEKLQDTALMELGTQKMYDFALKAWDVIEKNSLERLKGIAYRFLGRSETYLSDYAMAKEYYEKALKEFSGDGDKSRLEVQGFLSDILIRLGEVNEGISLAEKTYREFYDSSLGKNLRKDDYFTWAVWMSGIAPRICNALVETSADFDKEKMKKWLEEVKNEISKPSGDATWGDHSFQFRMDEINKISTLLTALNFLQKQVSK